MFTWNDFLMTSSSCFKGFGFLRVQFFQLLPKLGHVCKYTVNNSILTYLSTVPYF